jgi:hypothetical protein
MPAWVGLGFETTPRVRDDSQAHPCEGVEGEVAVAVAVAVAAVELATWQHPGEPMRKAALGRSAKTKTYGQCPSN